MILTGKALQSNAVFASVYGDVHEIVIVKLKTHEDELDVDKILSRAKHVRKGTPGVMQCSSKTLTGGVPGKSTLLLELPSTEAPDTDTGRASTLRFVKSTRAAEEEENA